MKRKIVYIFSFFFLYTFAYSQELKCSISTTKIKYGEPIILKLEVKGNKSDRIVFPYIKDTLTYHLELLNRKIDTLTHDKIRIYTDSISFSVYELGQFKVPPQKVIINSKEYFSPEYHITVDSMVIDSLKQPLYDIRPIITEPKTIKDYIEQYWMYMLAGLIFIIIFIIVIISYYLEKKGKGSWRKKNSDLGILAIKKINKLEKSNYLNRGLSKKYYSELIVILKDYMEFRWKFPASKLITEDLISYLINNKFINKEEEEALIVIFHSADLAKFAKSRPTVQETRIHTEMARKFINDTKMEFLNLKEKNEY